MLVLSRKKQEKIVIGESIEIQVMQLGRNRVRLGISAPDHCQILRGELGDSASNPSPAQFVSAQSLKFPEL